MKKIAILPFDPIDAYEQKGTLSLYKEYFNPAAFFDQVWVISPLEKKDRTFDGFTVKAARDSSHFQTLLSEFQPDVLRVYGGGWNADYALAHRVDGIPILVSLHDTHSSLLRSSIRFADGIIAMSQVIKDLAIARGVRPELIRVMGNRVDTKHFQPADPQSAAAFKAQITSGRLILHIGRQCAQKNQDSLLRALPLLPKDFTIVFIGQGDAKPYQHLAEQLGIANRCTWMERIPNEELPLWYSACDVFCVPSRWEGFGIVFIEAAACGAPIVTSQLAPMNEYLTHQQTAWLVEDCESPKALAKGIDFMTTEHSRVEQIVRRARQEVLIYDKAEVDLEEADIYATFLCQSLVSLPRLPSSKYRLWKLGFLLRQHFIARKYRTLRDFSIRYGVALYRQFRQPLTQKSSS